MTTAIKKHLNLRVLFYVLSSCFTIVTMFYPVSCKKQKENASQESVEILRKEQERLKQSVQVKLQVLSKRNDTLQYQLQKMSVKLSGQKAQHLVKRTNVKQLIQSSNDSGAVPYDSIRQVVSDYVSSDEHQDSLYEATIEMLQNIVQVKDSTLEVVADALDQSGQITERSLARQDLLEKDLLKTQRKLKRKQTLNRVLSAGAIALAATTTLLIIR